MQGRPVVALMGTWSGDVDEGLEFIAPFRALARPLVDMSGVHRYVNVQQMVAPFSPKQVLQPLQTQPEHRAVADRHQGEHEMSHEVRSIRLDSGIALRYVTQGDASGVPVVFLHGITDSWRSFEPVLPHLPDTVRAFAVTQRGHGDSDRPRTGYRAADFANDLAGFLDAVGIESAVVVGHSMGATNAMRFALDYPERTRGLVLIGGFASFRGSAAVVEFNEMVVAGLTDSIDVGLACEFQLSTLARPISAAHLDAVVAETMKVPTRVWRAALDALLDDECTAELSAVGVPTLVVSGGQDAFSDRAQQHALVSAIRGARRIAYEQVVHALHWEAPAEFAADLLAFVGSLEKRPAQALQV